MNASVMVVEVAALTVVAQPATAGVGIVVLVLVLVVVVESEVIVVVVGSTARGNAEAFEPIVVAATTTVTAKTAVVNFFTDMTCSLNEVAQLVTNGHSTNADTGKGVVISSSWLWVYPSPRFPELFRRPDSGSRYKKACLVFAVQSCRSLRRK